MRDEIKDEEEFYETKNCENCIFFSINHRGFRYCDIPEYHRLENIACCDFGYEKFCKAYDKDCKYFSSNEEVLKIKQEIRNKLLGEQKIKEREFKVGDRVQFKDWDEMVEEFGIEEWGYIRNAFSPKMKHLCGTYAIINKIYPAIIINNPRIELKDFTTDGETNWNYNTSMIKHADEVENEEKENNIVEHPNHYCREGAMESIQEMVEVFGAEVVSHFCLCNIWKYRYRAADKNGTEDIQKSDQYMRWYINLKQNGTLDDEWI